MSSKILPVEVEAVATVKQVLADWNFSYVRKYSQKLRRNGEYTGERSHKFYAFHYNYHSLTARPLNEELLAKINSVLSGYTASISYAPWSGVGSISIRPIR